MVVRLRVPLTHWLRARNWNRAAAGACLTASRVANKVAVSTPLRIGSPVWAAVISVVVIVVSPQFSGCRGRAEVWSADGMRPAAFPPGRGGGSGGGQQPLATDGPGGQRRRLGVDGGAELLLQLDEGRHRRVGAQLAGDAEDLRQRLVALLLVCRQRGGLLALRAAERLVQGGGQQLGVAEGVADAVGGDRVPVVAGVPGQRPARAAR